MCFGLDGELDVELNEELDWEPDVEQNKQFPVVFLEMKDRFLAVVLEPNNGSVVLGSSKYFPVVLLGYRRPCILQSPYPRPLPQTAAVLDLGTRLPVHLLFWIHQSGSQPYHLQTCMSLDNRVMN